MNQPVTSCFAFGEFLLDGAERRLTRNGAEVPLAPKVFDTLLLFVENPGHLLAKDELIKRLWPDTFVGDEALARNISTLRKALGESGDSQSYIATVSKRGYRFVAPVQKVAGAKAGGAEKMSPERTDSLGEPTEPTIKPVDPGRETGSNLWRGRIAFMAVVLAAGSLAGLVTFYALAPPAVPRVLRSTQLTHSGRVDGAGGIVREGSRIYYLEREGDHWNLMQNSVDGGESQAVAAPFRNTVVLDVSPDRANLLIGSFAARGGLMSLWVWPVQGGALKRVGDITAHSAAWAPNGRQIIYCETDGLYLADVDGTGVRKLVSTPGQPGKPLWSPDGHALRFSLQQADEVTMWEVNSDGSQLHRLLPAWNDNKPLEETAGGWTPDGKYFLFASTHSGRWDIWALPQARSWLRLRTLEPVRLTFGSLSYGYAVASDNGRKLFVIAVEGGGELARYDLKSHQAVSLLAGVCNGDLAFSPDSAWVVCSSTEGSLVRMKPDGSERVVLSSPPLTRYPENPRWSPDQKQIVFTARTANGDARMFLVSSEGGTPRELFADTRRREDGNWSPDGKLMAFARAETPASAPEPSYAIQVLDLSTNQLSEIPGSQGMRCPTWSPDGRFIAAATEDLRKVMLFDRRSQQWTQLAETAVLNGHLVWAGNREWLYYQDLLAANEPVYRVRISDRKKEVAASFESLLSAGVQRVFFLGFGPDESLVVSLDRNTADIYALDVDFP